MGVKVRESLSENGINIASLENLKTLITNIAECQACEIRDSKGNEIIRNGGFNVKKIATQLISSHLFEALDKQAAEQEIQFLSDSTQNVLAEDVLVKDQSIGKPVPLSYEVLSLIFAQTDEKFRQKYFHELVDFYYNELCKGLNKIGCSCPLTRARFDVQIKLLLPVVKLETLFKIVENGESGNQQLVTELVTNISNFFNSPRMNQEDIYAVVRCKIGSNNFDLVSYELIPLDERNGHFGDYFQVKIVIKHRGTKEILNLFAKFLTPKTTLMKALLKLGPSMKEEFFYLVYLPKLKALGLSELLDFAPNCYFSRMDDVLVLDDMSTSGYVGLTPNNRLQYDAIKLAVEQIAKFHACSFIFEHILSEEEGKPVYLYDLYGEYLQEALFLPDHEDLKQTFDSSIEIIVFLSSQFPGLSSKYSEEQLREKARKGWKLASERVKRSDKHRNVICHGDMHIANMLYKYDEYKACHAVKLIDFQLTRYCPPTQDLMFLLYQNAYKDTFDRHKAELIEEYYKILSSCLEKFNLDVTEVYPREDFDESVKYMHTAVVFHALYYSPMQMIDSKIREQIFQDDKEIEKYSQEKFGIFKMGMKGDTYRRVMKGLVEGFIELCDSEEL